MYLNVRLIKDNHKGNLITAYITTKYFYFRMACDYRVCACPPPPPRPPGKADPGTERGPTSFGLPGLPAIADQCPDQGKRRIMNKKRSVQVIANQKQEKKDQDHLKLLASINRIESPATGHSAVTGEGSLQMEQLFIMHSP